MSGTEHQATVDKGLKMKIKRTKNVGPSSGGNSGVSGNKNDSKHEVIKSSSSDKSSHSSADFHTSNANGTSSSATDKTKSSLMNSDKDKSPKVKGVHRKDKMKEKVGKGAGEPATSSSSLFSVSTSLDAAFSQVSLEPKHGEVANSNKKDNPLPDPYEFNAKEEDGFGLPVKKMKVEKLEPSAPVSSSTISQTVCVGTDMCSVGVATEPECLGPCEPGTSVNLEGIVWHETENGMLVVNVTWRGKTYVGTLLDATKHDWAPPRLNCDSPISDFETRTPKGRAKRGRGATSTPVNERDMRKLRKGRRGSNTFQAPPSPAKSDISTGSGIKRKSRPPDIDLSANDSGRSSKRSRSCSRGTPGTESPVLGLIECPEPNCNKKYKHMNGLRYHQSHAHQGAGLGGEEIDDELRDNEDSILDELDSTTVDSCDIGNSAAKDAEISDMDGEKKMEEEEESNVDNSEEISKSVRSNSPVKVTPVIGQKKDAFVTNSNTIATNSASKSLNVSGHVFQVVSHHSTTANVTAPIQTQTMSSTTLPMTVSQQVPITATVVASCSVQITMPITVTAMSTVSQSIESKSDTLKSDKSGDKSRSQKPGNRPIMPSHMIALSSSVSVTQSNVGPVTTPSSNVSQLKPIQPKPASMKNDSKNTNSPFAGLKELKRKEMKEKKRQREMMSGTSGSSPATSLPKTGTPKPEHPKEQSSVIKVTPIAPKPMESNTNRLDINVRKSDIDKPTSNVGMTAVVQPLNKGIDLSTQRQVEPPSVLKVSSPLSITATDTCKSNINDDVQSPAYSDISDANEAASPAAPQSADSPQKNKDNVQLSNKNKDLPNSATDQNSKESNPVSQFGMYGPYYGQQPYLLSSLSPSAQGSQSMNSPKMPTSAKDQNSEQAKLQNSDLKLKRESSKDDKREDVDNKQDPSRSLSEQEYQHMQHQKWVQQQMYALQSLPPHAQYDYFAAYGPYLDPAYHMHLMSTNLQYRQHFEKVMEEQKRMQPPPSEGGARKEIDGVPNRPVDRPGEHPSSSTVSATTTSSDSNVVSDDSQQGKASTYLDISYSSRDGRDGEKKRHSVDSMVDRDTNKDRAIREKQNENHQILKENIDLKAQMDRCHPYEQNFDPFRMSASRDKTSEEQARRLQMYQQQKMIEHQKREEQKKLDGNKSEHRPDMSGKPSSSVDKLRDHSGEGASRLEPSKKDLENKNKDMPINVNNIKTEPGEPKSGSSSDKTRTPSSERGRSVETADRARSIENPSTERVRGLSDTPKSKPGLVNKASSPTPSMSASVTPYLQYPSYQYMQSPPYGQMPYEPGHPMYHGINPALNPAMMYPGAYLHPSQLGYRVGSAVEVDDKDKLAGSSSSKKLMMDDEKSKLSSSADSPIHGSHYYGSGHKIHELQEKRLSSPHRSSPVPSKGGDSQPPTPTSLPSKVADKNREFSSSPPTQRHVHTHHHTHVLETAYPVYPLSTMFPGTPQQTTSPSLQHPTFPPGK